MRTPRKHLLPLLLMGLAGVARVALGDGMPIERGRVVGRATTITLTDAQLKCLRAAEAQGKPKLLTLSKNQRVKLWLLGGAAPPTLGIYNTRTGENDCTCEASNLGPWFAEFKVPRVVFTSVAITVVS